MSTCACFTATNTDSEFVNCFACYRKLRKGEDTCIIHLFHNKRGDEKVIISCSTDKCLSLMMEIELGTYHCVECNTRLSCVKFSIRFDCEPSNCLTTVMVCSEKCHNVQTRKMKRHLILICEVCGKDGKLMTCAKCKIANYCSLECQRKHWSKHKLVCGN